ncbi:MAG: amidohydrolase, partial [Gemmataceae bacterium]
FKDYNAVGLTTIGDRDATPSAIDRYRRLHKQDKLTVRVAVSHHIETIGAIEKIQHNIRRVAEDPLFKGDDRLRIIGIKTYLDGGMLTGSAYMRKPWGVSKIYSIKDPEYRGVLFVAKDRLLPIVRTTLESGLQFTAHSVGDGAVETLVDVYEELARTMAIRKARPCVTHCNFMSAGSIRKMAELGVVADIQPAWLYLDTRTLTAQFGYDRLRYFQPLKSLFAAGVVIGGGSDHMQKIGSLRSVNFYNPFLAMWTTIARKAKLYKGQLHPEEALSREQAIRFYTANNAYILFLDKRVGSLETGKLADLIVIDRDLLACPVDDIKDTKVLRTYIDGKLVFQTKPSRDR